MISATLYSDPACPWAYSESPALRVIEWRYGDQLDWRLVLVGLTEDASQYERRGYTPIRGALGQAMFRRRYGMPFAPAPKSRLSATSRACRAVVAARMSDPGSEWRVFRAIQLHNFNSAMLLDDDQDLVTALRNVPGIDAEQIVGRIDAPDVVEAYRTDREQTRMAEGSAAELQGKTATTDGPVRFTAPSVVFESNGTRLVAGGFQPVEAYDILVANIDPKLHREPPPEEPAPLLERFPEGLTTQEVAALLAGNNEAPDRAAAEAGLLELVGAGAAVRDPLGDDALWRSAVYAEQAAMVPSAAQVVAVS
ncbi:MAG TPA: DsbA family protein [Solirubrobacteraceae bacterium]|nr:DsbA family protein [Solirubrobacteraceae bacterium]